jgi:hypothetical protein
VAEASGSKLLVLLPFHALAGPKSVAGAGC